MVERVVIAVNAPLRHAQGGRPAGAGRRPVDRGRGDQLRDPAGRAACRRLRDADLVVHIVGRDAQIALGKAAPPICRPAASCTVVAACSRCPTPRRISRRRGCVSSIDGPVPAAAELLAHGPAARRSRRAVRSGDEPRHDDGAGRRSACRSSRICRRARPITRSRRTSRISPPSTWSWGRRSKPPTLQSQRQQSRAIRSKATSRSAARRPTSNTASRAATPTPRCVSQAMLDEAARAQSRLRSAGAISGADADQARRPGRRPLRERDGRFAVDADLTPAKIDDLLPGWVEAGRQAGARHLHRHDQAASRSASTIFVDRRRRRRREGQRSNSTAPASCMSANFPVLRLFRRRQAPASRPSGRRTARCA